MWRGARRKPQTISTVLFGRRLPAELLSLPATALAARGRTTLAADAAPQNQFDVRMRR